jgi:anti-sigma-K factor RskA
MKDETVTDAVLREFLLGTLSEKERDRIESRFLTDPDMRERVLAGEQDLIEDYLEDSLTKEEKERFLSLYGQNHEQRRKLRINGAIKDWAVREARVPNSASVAPSLWSRIWAWLRVKPHFLVPLAAAIVIAVVLAIVWRNSQIEQQKHSAIEQQLAQLNSPASLREVPSGGISLELKPVSVRSVEAQAELKITSDTRFVDLNLAGIQNERYSTYGVVVRRRDKRDTFIIPNVQAESDGGYTIRIRLPAQMLTRGHYEIELTGITADGPASFSEQYSFFVN